MATPQQKVFCVLEFVRTNSVVTVQRAVQALSGGSNSCRTQDVWVRVKTLADRLDAVHAAGGGHIERVLVLLTVREM
jgi:hypothetical protein